MPRPVRDMRDQEEHYICDSQKDQVPPPDYPVKPTDRRLVFASGHLLHSPSGRAYDWCGRGWHPSMFDGATTTIELVLGSSVLTGAPRRWPRSASLSKASMTTRGPFKRILDDPQCGEVLMDWQVARPSRTNGGCGLPCRRVRHLSFSIHEQPTRNACATASHLGVAMMASKQTQDQSVVVVSGRGDHNRWSCQPQKCRNRNVCCEWIYRHERHRHPSR
jgi:hypothetical protein